MLFLGFRTVCLHRGEQFKRRPPDLGSRHDHRRQRRLRKFSEEDVVETHNGQRLGNSDAVIVRIVNSANCHQVVGAEDRGRPGSGTMRKYL